MKFQVYQDHAGEWRWRLVARNGNTIADCAEGYTRKANCLRSLRRVRWCASEAQIEVFPKSEPDWHNEY